MSELTNIHARAVKDLTTPSNLPTRPNSFDNVKLVAGNFPSGFQAEAMTVNQLIEVFKSAIQTPVNNLADIAYPTLAEALTHMANLPKGTIALITNDGANNGLYLSDGDTLNKTEYDAIVLSDVFSDIQTIMDVVNGAANTKAISKLGRDYWTLATLDALIASGLLKIEDFEATIGIAIEDLEATIGIAIEDLEAAIDIAAAAGAGANGWTAQLVLDNNGKTQQEINDSTFRVNAKLLGIVPFSDATTQLEYYLNDSVTHEIYLPKGEYIISDTIVVDAPIPKKIYGEIGATLKTNFTTPQRIFDLSSQVDFKSIIFDFGNNHCSNATYYRSGFGLEANLSEITLQNLYDKVDSIPSYLIQTQTDVKINISNITVKNIRKYTDAANPNENGLFSAILLSSDQLSVGRGGTVSGVYSENIANVNSSGVRVRGGGAKTVHAFSQGGVLPVLIENISGTNFGRRLVKIQSSGVTARNIKGHSDFDDVLTVIASQSDGSWVTSGNKLKGITATGKIGYGFVVTSDDTTVDGVTVDIKAEYITSRGFQVQKSKGVRLKNLNLAAQVPMFFDLVSSDIKDIEIENVTLNPYAGGSYGLLGSNPDSFAVKGMKIKNITVKTDNTTTGKSLFGLNNTGVNTEFDINGIYIFDKNSQSSRISLGVIKSIGLSLNGVNYYAVGGVYPNTTDISDVVSIADSGNVKIDEIFWGNTCNRGFRFTNCYNVSVGANLQFPQASQLGHFVFVNTKNAKFTKLDPSIKVYQQSSVIDRPYGTLAQIPTNAVLGSMFFDTTYGSLYTCTSGASIDAEGNVTVPSSFVRMMSSIMASAIYDPPLLAPNERTPLQTITVTGATSANAVVMSYNQDLQGVSLVGYISAANTVTYYFENRTSASVNLNGGTVTVKVL